MLWPQEMLHHKCRLFRKFWGHFDESEVSPAYAIQDRTEPCLFLPVGQKQKQQDDFRTCHPICMYSSNRYLAQTPHSTFWTQFVSLPPKLHHHIMVAMKAGNRSAIDMHDQRIQKIASWLAIATLRWLGNSPTVMMDKVEGLTWTFAAGLSSVESCASVFPVRQNFSEEILQSKRMAPWPSPNCSSSSSNNKILENHSGATRIEWWFQHLIIIRCAPWSVFPLVRPRIVSMLPSPPNLVDPTPSEKKDPDQLLAGT